MARKRYDPKARKKKGLKAGIIAFGAAFAAYALLPFPLYRVGDYVLASVVSLLIAKVVSIMAQGPDLRSMEEKQREADPLPVTGDAQVDELFQKGQDLLDQIAEANAAIEDQRLSKQMDELSRLVREIFRTVADKPKKAPQIRRFMDYYLPTTLKMLSSWQRMDERSVTGEEAMKVRRQIYEAMDVVVAACDKQLNHLYQDDYLDISTDIDVLQQMLRRDGLTETDFTPLHKPDNRPQVQQGGQAQ